MNGIFFFKPVIHHHHQRHVPRGSVAVPKSCCQRSLFCALLKAAFGPRFRGSRSVVTPRSQVCQGHPTGLFQVLGGGPVIALRALAWSSSASQRATWPKNWSFLLSTISDTGICSARWIPVWSISIARKNLSIIGAIHCAVVTYGPRIHLSLTTSATEVSAAPFDAFSHPLENGPEPPTDYSLETNLI